MVSTGDGAVGELAGIGRAGGGGTSGNGGVGATAAQAASKATNGRQANQRMSGANHHPGRRATRTIALTAAAGDCSFHRVGGAR